MAKSFVFQQFTLEQAHAAFKLGTDSVALACWLPVETPVQVMDMGAGTGIISLVLAQRFQAARMTAVEMDEGSVQDCANNFSQSPWKERLSVIHADMMEWTEKNKDLVFDLLITNPPYFTGSLKSSNTRKNIARHADHLPFDMLARMVNTHLSPTGKFALVLPPDGFIKIEKELMVHDIMPEHTCLLRSYANGQVIRKMGVFTRVKTATREEDRYLYKDDKTRSEWYAGITDAFYLKKDL